MDPLGQMDESRTVEVDLCSGEGRGFTRLSLGSMRPTSCCCIPILLSSSLASPAWLNKALALSSEEGIASITSGGEGGSSQCARAEAAIRMSERRAEAAL